jgi:hypothetical protein
VAKRGRENSKTEEKEQEMLKKISTFKPFFDPKFVDFEN